MSFHKNMRDKLAGMVGDLPLVKNVIEGLGSGDLIFAFHRVLPKGSDPFELELCTSEEVFSDFLDWIMERCKIVSLPEVAARVHDRSDRRVRRCALTFDDGWQDNFQYAFPHLVRRNLTATIFLPTHFIGTQRRLWQEQLWLCLRELKTDDRRREIVGAVAHKLPWFPPLRGEATYYNLRRLLLTRPSKEAEEFAEAIADYAGLRNAFPGRAFLNWDEVRQMQASGIQFGSHTLNHTLLPNEPPKAAQLEIEDSRSELEARIKDDVTSFAYPWGAVGFGSLEHLRVAKYKYAVTTIPGLVGTRSHSLLLPRIPIGDSALKGTQGRLDRGKTRLYFAKKILTNSSRWPLKSTKLECRKPIKILFVLDLISEWEGGTERQLRLLISSLDRKYFEPKLCFLFKAETLPAHSLPCPLILVPSSSGPMSQLKRLVALVRLIKKERPDIVQCFFIEGLIFGILASRLAGVRHVIGSVRNGATWEKFYHRIAMRSVTHLANYWQTNSRTLWSFQNGTRGVPGDRLEILPNGTDVSRFQPATKVEQQRLRRELGLNDTGPICVSVANLSRVKGLETLIRSAAPLRERLPGIQFVLVGGGEQREELEGLARDLGVSGIVKFVGRQADVRPYLAAADIGVLTSHSEGSSNSVLEYMAMGVPSVVSDIPANRELLEQVTFKAGDELDLAAKISHLWQDKAARERLSREYREIVAQYSIEKFVSRVQSFYSKVALTA
jgi:glycosyltransferase involved in cell wall biosynthesis/peptidoglycan/xylan/chitin deacetylase (PgdA/CDA1 family)